MKKIVVFLFIFILFITFVNNFVYASSNDSTVYGQANPYSKTSPAAAQTANAVDDSDVSVSVGSTAALSSSSLSLSDILNIILIVLGILLVLFAIAILIRMH